MRIVVRTMTTNLRIRVCAARTVLVAALPACALRAQTSSTQGALLYRLGRDTTAVERFTASPGRLEGDIVQRDPTTRVHHYVRSLLRPDGSAADLEYVEASGRWIAIDGAGNCRRLISL